MLTAMVKEDVKKKNVSATQNGVPRKIAQVVLLFQIKLYLNGTIG